MLVYEFADGSWVDEVTAIVDRINTEEAVLVAEVAKEDWDGPWYATAAKAALARAREL